MALQHVHVFRQATCGADKRVHTANVTLLWQSDTTPGLPLPPKGVCEYECVYECVCNGELRPCFLTRTLPSINWGSREDTEGQNHDSTTVQTHQWNSPSGLNPPNGIEHTCSHEHTHSLFEHVEVLMTLLQVRLEYYRVLRSSQDTMRQSTVPK